MSDYVKRRMEQLGLTNRQTSDTVGNANTAAKPVSENYVSKRIRALGLDKPKQKPFSNMIKDEPEEESDFVRKLRQDTRFSDFSKNAAQIGLSAYERMKFEGPTPEQRQQKQIMQAAWAPLADAIPAYWQTVQQYANDTSYQEPTGKWSEDQRMAFGYLYGQDKDSAFQYAQEVNNTINSAAKDIQREAVQKKATGGILPGAWETGKAVVAGMAGIGDYLNDVAEYAARGTVTEKGNRLSPTEYADAVTGGISQKLSEYGTLNEDIPVIGGKGWGDVYGMGVSMGTSMLSGHALGRVGSLVQFFGSAAASAVDEAKSRGASDEQALAMGFASGASEALTEVIPIDNLLNMGAAANLKGALWDILKQSGEEFLGEGANAIISTLADTWIMADKSNFALLKQDYIKKGFSEEEAKDAAYKDLWGDIAFDAISGAITGAGSASVELGIQGTIQNRHYRKTYGDSTGSLIQVGLEAPADSLSHTLAESYQAKLDSGKQLTGGEINRLVKANEQQYMSTEYDSIRESASELLTTLGEMENVVGIADIIAKKVTRQKVSKAEQTAFDRSSFGTWVMEELSPDTARAEWTRMWADATNAVALDYTARNENLKAGGFIMPHSGIVRETAQEQSDETMRGEQGVGAQEITMFAESMKAAQVVQNTVQEPIQHDSSISIVQEGNAIPTGDKSTPDSGKPKGKEKLQAAFETKNAEATAKSEVTRISTGEPVKVVRIAEVGRNGDMQLEIEDGSSIDAEDIQYASEEEEVLYSSIAKLGAGTETSNLLLKAYTDDPGGVSPSTYAAGMMDAFAYGQYNIPKSEIVQNKAIQALTEVQRNTAYELGRHFGNELVQTKEANARRARAAARAKAVSTVANANAAAQTGKVHFNRKGRTFSEVQETGLKTMEQLSQLLGVEFHVFESYEKDGKRLYIDENGNEKPAPNGYYRTGTGHIYVDLNAGIEGKGTVLYTVAHEMTHFTREWSPEKFHKLAEAVFQLAYKEQDISVAQLIQNQQDKATRDGRELSFEEAYEEVIADSMEGILTDGNVLTELSGLIQKQDASLWEKIRDWFRKLAEDIRAMVKAYSGYRPDSYEGRAVAELEEMLPAIEGFYTDALQEASANYRAAERQKNTTQESGKKNHNSVRTSFANELQEWFDTTTHEERKVSGKRFLVGTTTDVLKNIGVKDYQIYFGGSKIDKILTNNTSMTLDTIKKAVMLLENPILIMQSRTVDDSIVLFGEVYTDGDKPVMISVLLNPKTKSGEILDYAVITSAYGRRSNNVQNLLNQSTIYYVNENKNRTEKWLQALGLQLPSAITKFGSITSISSSVTDVNKKFSQHDSDGANLSAAQAEYFRDSKVRDEDGNLLVMYHGTSSGGHTIFDPYGKSRYGLFGTGSYFTDNKNVAEGYTKKGKGKNRQVYKTYLNIKNPMDMDAVADPAAWRKMFPDATLPDSGTNEQFYRSMEEYFEDEQYSRWEAAEIAMGAIEDMGYDGITHIGGGRFNKSDDTRHRVYIVFQPEQIKSVDNTKPTENPDIRYSQRDTLQEKALAAAQKENEKLKADVARLKKLVKLQDKVTGGTVFTESSILTAARQLKKTADAKGDTGELVEQLKKFYRYTIEEETLSWEGIQEAAKPAVDWLVKNRRRYRTEYAQAVLRDIRGRSISFSEEQQTEAARYMGSFNDYRKSMFGNVRISKDGLSLDETWHELSGLHPSVFPEDTTPGDMPRVLAEIVNRMKNSHEYTQAYSEDMVRQEMLQAILDSRWELKTVQTVADKKQEEIDRLKADHVMEMQEVRTAHKMSLDSLRLDYQNSRNIARDNREKAEIRHKIRGTVKKLDSLLKSETKEKHVPDSLKKAVAEALSLLNDIELGTAQKRVQLLDAEIRELEASLEKAKGEEAQNLRAQLDEKMLAMDRYQKSGDRLAALKDAYADIKNSKDPDVAAGYDAEVAGNLAELAESIQGTSFQKMSKEQLQEVYDMYTMVLTRIRDANKQFGARRGETLRENAEEVSRDIRRFGISEKDPGLLAGKIISGVRSFSWNELRPVDAFHRLGSEKLERLYMDLVDGMAQRGRMIQEIGEFVEETRRKAGYKKFDLKTAETYTTVDGKEMKLTLAEKMSIYAYSKRQQAYDHMTEGGFTYADGLTYRENGKLKLRKETAETWRLSLEDLQNICTSLTAEQQEYVDTMQKFLTEFGKHGDRVNMELYGIKLFNKEDAYFPLKSDRDYRSSVETQLNRTMTSASLKNAGMTKKTKPGANNPIVLEAFDQVVFSHLDEMVNYANLVLPLENLRRVFDYQTAASEDTDPTSMKALIAGVFGKEARQYIDQFLMDANGTQLKPGVRNPLETMFTRNKGMAVAANLSVSIQQISAVVRAGAEISPKHLLWAAENSKGTKLYDEMVKYAPIAVIKDMGGFDTGNSRSLEDYIGMTEAPMSVQKAWSGVQKVFGFGAETMDKVGWCLIWNGVKREVASRKQYKVNSEEFLQECGKRFTEVIVKTQVYDSVLSRSGYMRDKHGTMRYLTSFMGEPTVQAGMVFRSHLDVVRAVKEKKNVSMNVRKLLRTDAALICALVVNGMLKSIPYAMRDDDEDEGYWERWAKQMGSAVSELWKPWELLPVLRNLEDLATGRTIEQPDTVLLGDLLQAGYKVYDVIRDEEKLGEMTAEDWYKLAQDLSGSVGNFLGVPVRNIWRDAEGVARAWKDATDGIDSDGMMLDAFWRGLAGEEKSKYEGIYDATINGDSARLKALQETYSKDSAYESAVRKALREHDSRIKEAAQAHYDGDFVRYDQILDEIEKEGNFSPKNIKLAIDAEVTELKNNAEETTEETEATAPETVYRFDSKDYFTALFNGDKKSANLIYRELHEKEIDEGYIKHEAESNIRSALVSQVKGAYMDEDITKTKALKMLKDHTDKDETEIKKWDFEKKHDYSWSARHRGYRLGAISKSQLIAAVKDIEGASQEEAEAYIRFLDLEKASQDIDITAADAQKYFEDAEPRGISINRYMDYVNSEANYISGEKTDSETKKLLHEVGRVKEEELDTQLVVYDLKASGYEKATVDRVNKYQEYCKPMHISWDMYYGIAKFASETKNDIDENGDTIDYSAVQKIMVQINNLGIDSDQKTAIAKSMGWKASTIRKYKQW